MTELAIEAEGLVKVFGETRAVDGIDLAVRRGAVYGVLGPNGAGKTTTIRMLATLLHPDAGTARVLGHDIVREAAAVRAPDEPDRAVRVGRRGAERAARTCSCSAACSGSASAGRRREPTSCSPRSASPTPPTSSCATTPGGMRRRLDIAASIVVTPDLLFLDEPTTGLDPRSRNQVWDIVRVLVAEGATVLLTTQYLDEADQLADRLAIIDHGRVIAEGHARRAQGLRRRRLAARPASATRTSATRPAACSASRSAPTSSTESDPAALSAADVDADRAAGRARPPSTTARHPRRRVRPRPAQPGRGVPRPHRTSRRRRRPTQEEERGMTHRTSPTPSSPRTPCATPLATTQRPSRPSALSASLSFGWRAMLKIKHVPLQLFDVTVFPIMFVLLYTYLFGGALAGSPREYLQELLPGILVMNVTWITMYTGPGPQAGHGQGRVRPLPLAADLAPGGARRDAPRRRRALHDLGAVMLVVGIALGFRPDGGVLGVLAAVALLLVFAFCLSWVWTTMAFHVRDAGVGDADRHDRAVPADVRQQRVRRPGHDAGLGPGVRQRQPDQLPGDGVTRASCTATSTPPPSAGSSCGRPPCSSCSPR